MRSGYNNLRLQVYSTGTTLAADPLGDLVYAGNINFETVYPGGIFGGASFYIPKAVTDYMDIRGGYRVVMRNGPKLVYEGPVASYDSILTNLEQGVQVNCASPWFWFLEKGWGIDKRWADTRTTPDVWEIQATTTEDLFELQDIDGNLHFSPRAATFADGQYGAIRYTMPTGQTAKRLTYDCNLTSNTGSWEISAWRSTDGATWTVLKEAAPSSDTFAGVPVTSVVTADGTTESHDITFNTASQYVELRYYARGANTPVADDLNHGYWDNVCLYSETDATITAAVVVADCLGICTELNTDTTQISANTLGLEPFITSGYEPLSAILARVAGYGDASYNAWAVGLLESEKAATPNGAPVMYYEQQPADTDYDYIVRLDEMEPTVTLTRDFSQIINYVVLAFTDLEGRPQIYTPADNAALTDAASVAAYGRKMPEGGVINLGTASSGQALSFGQTVLAKFKDPLYNLSAPVQVTGAVRGKNGNMVPACEIRAGKRLKIANFLQDLSGTGLTFIITGTSYNDATETVQITAGQPGSMDVYLAKLQAGLYNMAVIGGGMSRRR